MSFSVEFHDHPSGSGNIISVDTTLTDWLQKRQKSYLNVSSYDNIIEPHLHMKRLIISTVMFVKQRNTKILMQS